MNRGCLLASAPFSLNLIQDIRQMLQHDFMRTAFGVSTFLAIAAGLAGFFVVLRGQAFAAEALSHVAFVGALSAAIAGIDPRVGLIGLTALLAPGMGSVSRRERERDVATGIVMAWISGVGALLISLCARSPGTGGSAAGVRLLFGSLYSIESGQAHLLMLVAAGASLSLLALARPLLFASLDPEAAGARGVPVRGLGILFLLLLALTVSAAVPAIGALLYSALLITPAAIAQNLTARPYRALFLSAGLTLAFLWVGLIAGFYTAYPVSSLVGGAAFASYVLVIAWKRRKAAA